MKGFPPEYYEPLPPHSPKDRSREEVINKENYSKSGSATIPLMDHPEGPNFQEAFVPPTNPPLTNPLGPLLVQVNSFREFKTDYPRLQLVPFEEILNMELE
jgi:hypothetical protein